MKRYRKTKKGYAKRGALREEVILGHGPNPKANNFARAWAEGYMGVEPTPYTGTADIEQDSTEYRNLCIERARKKAEDKRQ